MTRAFAQSSAKAPLPAEHSQSNPLTHTALPGDPPVRHFRVTILGTGFAGLGMAIRLKQRGYTDFVVLEKAADVGGTWRDNTYPGCACDVQSHLYSFSFAPNPRWSHAYSSQQEIWEYLRNCAERFGVRPHIHWNSEILDACWDENEQRWQITTTQGKLTATMLILGNGPLSEPSLPAIPGIEQFEGTLFHSARWDHTYDLAGKRVAVIGTGASAIQFVPRIQPQVAHLSLFQRTPPWILPRQDHLIDPWKRALFRLLPFTQRLARTRIYWQREMLALGFLRRLDRMKDAEQLALRFMQHQITDPALRTKLTPHYSMGCKRILLSDDFYPALAQPNVELVTASIREVRVHSIVTEDGNEHEIDTIICGTGFHVTDTAFAARVRGRAGQSLADRWQDTPDAYLGTAIAGFPNLFLLIGPNTGLGHSSMVFMIESHVTYILDCLRTMERNNWRTVEVKPEIQETFNAEMQQRMRGTVWSSGCKSWYLASGGRNTTLWPGFTFEFRRRTRHFDRQSYQAS
ncbi:MAG TPA: NAD(P)/FAD-dependent oxidoreductase [Ktedonobacteraceae bacterium]|nr:NAD(P)/FAD-dependent oxidoreductase [Ktedonobacteraceae bacterium]